MHKIDRLTFLKQNILAYKLQNKCDNNREPGHKLHEVLNVVVPEESHEHPEEDPREHSHPTGRNHHQGQQVGGARALVPEKPDYKNRKRKNSFRSLEPIFFLKFITQRQFTISENIHVKLQKRKLTHHQGNY